MRIIVSAKSRFGILNAEDNKWYNPQDAKTIADYKIGGAYDIVIENVKGSDGKSRPRVTKAVAVDLNAAPAAVAVVEKSEPQIKKYDVKPGDKVQKAPMADKGLSFGEKDARILYQGVAQALVQSSLVLSLKDLEPAVVHVVEMIKRLSGTK